MPRDTAFGAKRLRFCGPDGDPLAFIETINDGRSAWTAGGVGKDVAICGFYGLRFDLHDTAATAELLAFMGYVKSEQSADTTRFTLPVGNDADTIDLTALSSTPFHRQVGGSVHHIAFAVENRQKQIEVRKALMNTGYQVTPVIHRGYFWAIYFRTPAGVLFESAKKTGLRSR